MIFVIALGLGLALARPGIIVIVDAIRWDPRWRFQTELASVPRYDVLVSLSASQAENPNGHGDTTMSSTAEAVHTPSLPAWALYRPFRMSTNQYEKLVDSGVFTKKDKLQLIDGILVAKVTQNPPHSVADLLCGKALRRVIPPGWHLRPDKPLRLPPYNEPEPDHCVVRGAERDFLERHPGAADVGLLVEVADSSLAADREMGDLCRQRHFHLLDRQPCRSPG